MLRITKLTDYAIVVLTHMAHGGEAPWTARETAVQTGLPEPSVRKILKGLARSGVLLSVRGTSGGYRLGRPAALVTVADVIDAVEGPIAITDCSGSAPDPCEYAGSCAAETNWALINREVRAALAGISLSDMAAPRPSLVDLAARPRAPQAP
jgi:FeS assembly SUF system regulator